jgi:outer membrane protein OmpA-like peptidoglycan-associated protein
VIASTATELLLGGLLAMAPAKGSVEAEGSVSASARGGASGEGRADASGETRPMRKWAPERNMFELGLWGGVLVMNREHELYDPRVAPHLRFRPAALDLGLRFAYFPLRWLGGEIEAGVMPTRNAADARTTLYTVRGHLIGQLPWWRLTPFLLVGGGGMGVASRPSALGNDIDASFHWGPGLKFYANRWLAIRLDLRHLVGARRVLDNGAASHFEALLGLSLTLGRKGNNNGSGSDGSGSDGDPDRDGFYGEDDRCPEEAGVYPHGCPGSDGDGDGVADDSDECPEEPGPGPSGCPAEDKDGDTVADADDKCPDTPGAKPDGCPPDSDGDGVPDPDDECIDVAGDPPDGCPPDADDDGVPDPTDECIKKPETDNGYEDEDGCPDEVPKQLTGVTGVMPGITFETNSAKITRESRPTLDETVKVLKANPKYDVSIEGHTDDTGGRDYNVELSQKRADAVADYLVKNGVSRERVHTRGRGPDKPVADNSTAEGRAQNRRIEFKLRKRIGRRAKGAR